MKRFIYTFLLSCFLINTYASASDATSGVPGTAVIQRMLIYPEKTEAAAPGQQIKLTLSKPLAPNQSISASLIADPRQEQIPPDFPLNELAVSDKEVAIQIPDNVTEGKYHLNTQIKETDKTIDLTPLSLIEISPSITPYAWIAAVLSVSPFLILLILSQFKGIGHIQLHTRRGVNTHGLLKIIFVDPDTNSYSLSRAQFVLWSTVTVWAYLFIFLAQGMILGRWEYPVINGSGYAFLISLTTLLAAHGTTQGKGAMGSGTDVPKLSDLFMHGGVVALDRIQQVMWCLIGAGMYGSIVYNTYSSFHGLPEIPKELLSMMGMSSVGYVGGKLIRQAGPNATQANWDNNTPPNLVINGNCFSPDAFVWLNGKQLQKGADYKIDMSTDADKTNPGFASKITVPDAISKTGCATKEDWENSDYTITIINSDGQNTELSNTAKS